MATIYYAVVPKIPPPTGKSEILYGVENAMERGVYFISNAKEKMDIFFDHRAPSIVVGFEEYRNGILQCRILIVFGYEYSSAS